MKPRRILIFSLVYYPRFIGGAEIAIKEITDRIPSSDMEFDMITARFDSNMASFERIGNINVYRIGHGNSSDKVFFPVLGTIKALSLLRCYKYDSMWPMMVTYSSAVPYIVNIIRRLFGRTRIPIVLTLQEGDSEEHIRSKKFGIAGMIWRVILWPLIIFLPKQFRSLGLIGLSWTLALQRTDTVTVISTYLQKQAQRYGYTGPIKLIPNAVDLDIFSKVVNEQDIRELKGVLGKKENEVLLVTASRLVYKNAVNDIIDSLKYLDKSFKLLILGTGADEGELKDQVSKLKMNDRVIFQGFVPHDRLPEYLHASDIFIRPSRSEGLGNSFLEAMAVGIPVIATRVGGIPDFLVDGETGLFCEVNNPRSIAQKVMKLVKDKESRDYIVQNAVDMVRRKYEWKGIAERMKKIL